MTQDIPDNEVCQNVSDMHHFYRGNPLVKSVAGGLLWPIVHLVNPLACSSYEAQFQVDLTRAHDLIESVMGGFARW